MAARSDRRVEILATASRLFAADGFNGVSIDDLGAALGISGPAIYRYFSGKEAILAEMLVDISERLLSGARERAALTADPSELLDELIRFHIQFALTEPDLIAVQFRDLGSAPIRERRLIRQLQRTYADSWVEALLATAPNLSPERARASVHAVFGMLNSTPRIGRNGDPDFAVVLQQMAVAAIAAAAESTYA